MLQLVFLHKSLLDGWLRQLAGLGTFASTYFLTEQEGWCGEIELDFLKEPPCGKDRSCSS